MIIDCFDEFLVHMEIGARRRLCSGVVAISASNFVAGISPEPMRFERTFMDGSVGFLMYFHPINLPEFFTVAFRRKTAGKLFRRAHKLMVFICHEFVL